MTRWSRVPNWLAAIALVVLAGILAYAGVALVASVAGQCCGDLWAYGMYGFGMLGITAVVLGSVALGLAVVVVRAPGWWATGGIAAGALIPLTIGAALPSASAFLVLAAVLLLCALAAVAVQLGSVIGRRRDGVA